MAQQNRQEHNRLLDENAYNLDMKDLNYKLYYQRINDKQGNRQQVYDTKVGAEERNREKHLEDFVIKGVYDAKRKAEEEEYQRHMKKVEMQRDMAHNVRQKISEHEEQNLREKLAYREKVDKLMVDNQLMQERQEQQQREKANQMVSYKNILENQMREAEELSRKAHLEMPEHERKMQLDNFSTLVPGLKSTKADASPYARSGRTLLTNTEPDMYSPQNLASPKMGSGSPYLAGKYNDGSSPSYRPYQNDSLRSYNIDSTYRGDANGSGRSPKAANTSNIQSYNPITNPVPQNIQNPYLLKEIQKGNFTPKNYLASTASNSILNPAN